MLEEIEQFEHELTGIGDQLKTTSSHLDWDKLPESEKFQRLAPSRKQLVDTVKMITSGSVRERRWRLIQDDLGALPGRHLMLQPMLGRWSGLTGLLARTASSAARRSLPVTGTGLPGRLPSSWPR